MKIKLSGCSVSIRHFSRHTLFAAFFLYACLLCMPASAGTPCDQLKAERDKARAALNKIQAQRLPEDKIADVNAIVSELQQLMNSQTGDQKAVKDRIKQMQDVLPKSDAGIVGGINKFLKGVSEGVGVTGDQAKAAADFLGKMKEKLDVVQSFYTAGDEATAKGQIEQFGQFLDSLATATGASSIPGVKDLAAAYSQGIKGIAQSAGQIEAVVARNEQIYKEAGFTGDLYVHTLTPRQKREKMIDELSKRVNDLENQISDGDCAQPAQPDPCFDKNTRVARDIAQARKMMDNSDTAANLKLVDMVASEHFGMLGSNDPATVKQAARSYNNDVARRRLLRQEYDQRLGDLLDSASQGWSDQDKQMMENCYPYHSSLMHTARAQKIAKAKPTPGKNSTTTTSKTGGNTNLPKCQTGGGMAGALEGVARKEQGACQ